MLPPKTRPRRWQASEQASKGREFATGKYGKQATGKQASKASKRLACESPNSRRGCAEPGVKTEGGGREEEEKGGREGSRHGRRPRKDGRQHETELTCKNAIVASGPFNVGGGELVSGGEKIFLCSPENTLLAAATLKGPKPAIAFLQVSSVSGGWRFPPRKLTRSHRDVAGTFGQAVLTGAQTKQAKGRKRSKQTWDEPRTAVGAIRSHFGSASPTRTLPSVLSPKCLCCRLTPAWVFSPRE